MQASNPTTGITKGIERLPEFWPEEPQAEPVRAVWLPWPVAMLLLPLMWFMPKRMGPHFAAVRWPGVIAGHLFWTIYGIGCIAMAFVAKEYGWVAYLSGRMPGQVEGLAWTSALSEVCRSPLALLAFGLSQTITSVESFGLGIGVVVGVELGVVAIGAVLMPYAAAGEKSWRLFARCVKLTFWSTGSVIVLGLAFQAVELSTIDDAHKQPFREIAISLYVAWFVWICIRSGTRYAGPPIGPGWEQRQVRCEQCGYVLASLTVADRCPECGLAVAESLPENRRLPRFVLVRKGTAAVPAFFATVRATLFDRTFFKHLAIHEGHARARRFAILIGVLCGPLAFIHFALACRHVQRMSPAEGWLGWLSLLMMTWVGASVALICAAGLTTMFVSLFGVRLLRPRMVVVSYLTAWFIPISLSPLALPLAVALLNGIRSISFCRHLGLLRGLRPEEIYFGAIVCPLLFCVAPLLDLRRALRQTRFANR